MQYIVIGGLALLAYKYYKEDKENLANHYDQVTQPHDVVQYLTDEQKELGEDANVNGSNWWEIENSLAANVQTEMNRDPALDDPEGEEALLVHNETLAVPLALDAE